MIQVCKILQYIIIFVCFHLCKILFTPPSELSNNVEYGYYTTLGQMLFYNSLSGTIGSNDGMQSMISQHINMILKSPLLPK